MAERCCSTPFLVIVVERTVSAPSWATEKETCDISSALAPKQSAKAFRILTSSRDCGAGVGLVLGDGMVAGSR
jgi:hypothetical protein